MSTSIQTLVKLITVRLNLRVQVQCIMLGVTTTQVILYEQDALMSLGMQLVHQNKQKMHE